MFSHLISGGGDFFADGNFLGTSKCEGMLLLLWFVGRLANSCFTTGGNTVLLVITFLDEELGTEEDFPAKNENKNFRIWIYSHNIKVQASMFKNCLF